MVSWGALSSRVNALVCQIYLAGALLGGLDELHHLESCLVSDAALDHERVDLSLQRYIRIFRQRTLQNRKKKRGRSDQRDDAKVHRGESKLTVNVK